MSMNDDRIRMTIRVPNDIYQKFHAYTSERMASHNRVVVHLMERFVENRCVCDSRRSDATRRHKA